MPYDTQGFFYSCGISGAACFGLLLLAKHLHSNHFVLGLNTWRVYRSMWPHEPTTAFNFGGWGEDKARFADAFIGGYDPWLTKIQGGEARMYLSFLRLSGCVFAFVGLLSAVVLIPVYATDTYNRDSYWKDVWQETCCDENGVVKADIVVYAKGISDWTVRNVSHKSSRMWFALLVAVVLSYEVCAMVTKMVQELRSTKAASQMHTAVLRRAGDTPEKIKRKLLKRLPRSMWKDVRSVAVPQVPPRGMLSAMKEEQAVQRELERLYAIMEAKGIDEWEMFSHPKLQVRRDRKLCGSKMDSGIDYYRKRADAVHEKLISLKEEMNASERLVGIAYVTFHTPDACARMVATANQTKKGVRGYMKTAVNAAVAFSGAGEKTWFAPVCPTNILWSNAGTGRLVTIMGHVLVVGMLVLAALVWGFVVGFLGNLENFGVNMERWDPSVRGLITAYLPTIVASILVLLFPDLVRILIYKVERVPDKVEREVRECRYLCAFWLSVVLFLQVILQGASDSFEVLGKLTFNMVLDLFVDMLSPTNGYFVVMMMSSTFIATPLRLSLLHVLALGNMLDKVAFTKREADEAFYRRPFMFSEEYSHALLFFGFAVLLSVNLPYMGLFAACYFYMKYLVDRALLIDAYPRCRESTLRLVPVVVNYVLTLLLIMQLFGVVLLSLAKECIAVAVAGGTLMGATVLFAYVTYKNLDFLMGPEFLQGKSRPMMVLPSALGLLFGYDAVFTIDDTPFQVHGCSSGGAGSDATLSSPEASPRGRTRAGACMSLRQMSIKNKAATAIATADGGDIFDFDGLELSQYDNPCALYEPPKLDHKTMQKAGWLYANRSKPVPNPHLVPRNDVFMANLTHEELHRLLGVTDVDDMEPILPAGGVSDMFHSIGDYLSRKMTVIGDGRGGGAATLPSEGDTQDLTAGLVDAEQQTALSSSRRGLSWRWPAAGSGGRVREKDGGRRGRCTEKDSEKGMKRAPYSGGSLDELAAATVIGDPSVALLSEPLLILQDVLAAPSSPSSSVAGTALMQSQRVRRQTSAMSVASSTASSKVSPMSMRLNAPPPGGGGLLAKLKGRPHPLQVGAGSAAASPLASPLAQSVATPPVRTGRGSHADAAAVAADPIPPPVRTGSQRGGSVGVAALGPVSPLAQALPRGTATRTLTPTPTHPSFRSSYGEGAGGSALLAAGGAGGGVPANLDAIAALRSLSEMSGGGGSGARSPLFGKSGNAGNCGNTSMGSLAAAAAAAEAAKQRRDQVRPKQYHGGSGPPLDLYSV